jgi:hypothetical protein
MDTSEDRCTTCGEVYSEPPTSRASLCSNSFHCCKLGCVYRDGYLVDFCPTHREEENNGQENCCTKD